MRRIVCLLILWMPSGWLQAGESAGQAGAFLRIGLGPRARGMGDTYTAIADQTVAAYYNPAGLGFIKEREAAVAYSFMTFDRRFNYVGFSTPLQHQAGFSLGFVQSGFTDGTARFDNGEPTGEDISDNKWAVFMGFSLRFSPKLAIGLAPKFLYSKVYDVSSNSFGVDLGVMYRPVERLSVGLAYKELGQSFKYSRNATGLGDQTTRDRLPRTLRGGAAFDVPMSGTVKRVLFAVDYESVQDQPGRLHVGAEANLLDKIALRAGMDDKDLTAGFSVPFKIRERRLRFDYAFIHDSRSGIAFGSQDISLAYQF